MRAYFNDEEPYESLIKQHINFQFPRTALLNKCELVDALSQLIVGTKEVRYGSLPSPEHFVNIRKTISECITNNEPIPFLIPWGSIKSDFSGNIDIAELMAVKRIIQLSKDISEFYSPGVDMVLRLEDTSGYSLFSLESNHDTIKLMSDMYTNDMVNLLQILNVTDSIHAVPESTMKNASKFEDTVNQMLPVMTQYLIDSHNDVIFNHLTNLYEHPSYRSLVEMGWRGYISKEQREHYYSAYQKLYPNWEIGMQIKRLALYFSGSWARHILGMTGKKCQWENKFIQLAFVPPIKGLPEGYNHNYVYYRTLPLSDARTHIPAWRAKGYLKITGNDVCNKITSFSDSELISQLHPAVINLSDDSNTVSIKADYLLVS